MKEVKVVLTTLGSNMIVNEDSNTGSEFGETAEITAQTTEKLPVIPSEETSDPSSGSSTPARKGSIAKLSRVQGFANSQRDSYTDVLPESVHEYEWPPKSGRRYFIQEQVMEFLGVKSFKRKFPDLTRRVVEKEEREEIRHLGIVSENQFDLGLTALESVEVHDIMTREYPDHYEGYKKAVAERAKEALAAKQREMDSLKTDSKKMEELRRKAMHSVSEWNVEFNREKKRERNSGFVDINTMIIQLPKNKCMRLSAKETKPGPYPVAVMPGQFQNYYKQYVPEELKKLPVNSVINTEPFIRRKRPPSPPPITVDESELLPEEEESEVKEGKEEGGVKKEEDMETSSSSGDPSKTPSSATTKPTTTTVSDKAPEGEKGEKMGEHCAMCEEDIYQKDRFLVCSQCGSSAHPKCLDMSDELYHSVQQYDWMCMECKPCSVCKNLDGEDKMMFCDKCDRGYHTYCVGLAALPVGKWVCAKFCRGPPTALPLPRPHSPGGGSGRSTPGTPSGSVHRCRDCNENITKANKVHHRSKFSKEGICIDCAAARC